MSTSAWATLGERGLRDGDGVRPDDDVEVVREDLTDTAWQGYEILRGRMLPGAGVGEPFRLTPE